MKDFTKILVWGISLIVVFVTYYSVAQGWGVQPMRNKTITKKYASTNGPYGITNRTLMDSIYKRERAIKDSLRKRRRDSLKVVETKFNATRDSLKLAGADLNTYESGKYLYVFGYRRPRSSSYSSSGSSYSSGGYSSRSSSSGSFRNTSRSFRGGSRRGGK